MIRRSTSPAARSAAVSKLVIEINNDQRRLSFDKKRLLAGIRAVLTGEGVRHANISLAIVDDRTIHTLNRRYLKHDEPTDVISFLLEQDGNCLDGQIVTSADTAAAAAVKFGWNFEDELLLYVIHGALHLAGYDDLKPSAKRTMRRQEQHYLAQFGLQARYRERPKPRKKLTRP